MSDTKTPDAPSYAPYTAALGSISDASAKNATDNLAWANNQVANNTDLTNQVNNGLLHTQSTFAPAADNSLAAGTSAIGTGVGNLLTQYAKYTDPAKKAADMGAAEAGVAQGNEAARQSNMSELESYGLNPGAVRYAGLDAGARLQDAASRVGAGNVASRTDDALADTTNQQILGEGNQLVSQAGSQAATAGGAGTGAVGNSNATTATGGGVLGTGLQWTGAGTTANTAGAGATNAGFQNQATADQISNSSSSGLGSLLGVGASMLGKGGALASGGALSWLEDGGAVDDISHYAGGGAVPPDMSPSNGAAIDDVDAVAPGGPAKLNAGEFVIPKDATSWYGEKFMQNLIQKARQAKAEAAAKPQQRPNAGPNAGPNPGPNPASPAFQPRPQAAQQGALPV